MSYDPDGHLPHRRRLWEPQRTRRFQPAERREDNVWCHVTIELITWGHWRWLLEALRDVGLPVSGWSTPSGPATPRARGVGTMTLLGDGPTVKRAILELWENERPGYPIEVSV